MCDICSDPCVLCGFFKFADLISRFYECSDVSLVYSTREKAVKGTGTKIDTTKKNDTNRENVKSYKIVLEKKIFRHFKVTQYSNTQQARTHTYTLTHIHTIRTK